MDGRLQFHETTEGLLKVLPTDGPAAMSWRVKAGAEQPDHACKINACATTHRTKQPLNQKIAMHAQLVFLPGLHVDASRFFFSQDRKAVTENGPLRIHHLP